MSNEKSAIAKRISRRDAKISAETQSEPQSRQVGPSALDGKPPMTISSEGFPLLGISLRPPEIALGPKILFSSRFVAAVCLERNLPDCTRARSSRRP